MRRDHMKSHFIVIVSDPVLQFLLAGLQEPRLSSVSAQALQSIASMCRDHMKSHFHGLIQIAEAMDTFNLSSEAAIGLLKGNVVILTWLRGYKTCSCSTQLSTK